MNKEEMLDAIKSKLKLVNVGVLKADNIDDEKIDDLRDIYEMIEKRDNISPNEMAAITDALGQLRK